MLTNYPKLALSQLKLPSCSSERALWIPLIQPFLNGLFPVPYSQCTWHRALVLFSGTFLYRSRYVRQISNEVSMGDHRSPGGQMNPPVNARGCS